MNAGIDFARKFLLYTIVAAWPWEVFQQLPYGGMTLVKVSGAALIGLAIVDGIARGRLPFVRTGLEWPLAALMAACLISVPFSADTDASWSLIARYAMYIAGSYAVAWAVRSVRDATVAARVFLVSATVVAAVAILCSFGVLAPIFAEFAKQVGRRVAWDTETGALVRMAATAPDFNQGVLTFLLALPLALWLPNVRPFATMLKWLAVLVLIGGMLVAFSRSAIAVSLLLLAAYALWSMRRENVNRRNVLLLVMVSVLVMIAALPYVLSLTGRIERGIAGNEASIAHRTYVYRLAADLVPDYWLRGTGINASDAVIEAIGDPEKSGGQTLHSVPFKFLIETGVFGLAAYLWLWVQGIILIWRRYLREDDTGLRQFGFVALGAAFALFVMTLVQPFTHLSIYPVLLGLAFGPGRHREPADTQHLALPLVSAVAMSLIVVVPNVYDYQTFARETAAYAQHMEEGYDAETRGAWSDAREQYSRAQQALATRSTSHRYVDYAADVTGLEMLHENVGALRTSPDPAAAAMFAFGRAALAQRNSSAASTAFVESIRVEPDYAAASYLLAECLWNRGDVAQALLRYENAARDASALENEPYRRFLAPPSPDSIDATNAEGLVQRADAYRRHGDWSSALADCEAALALDSNSAHALYFTGIDAQLNGHPDEARRLFTQCLENEPRHDGAKRALSKD